MQIFGSHYLGEYLRWCYMNDLKNIQNHIYRNWEKTNVNLPKLKCPVNLWKFFYILQMLYEQKLHRKILGKHQLLPLNHNIVNWVAQDNFEGSILMASCVKRATHVNEKSDAEFWKCFSVSTKNAHAYTLVFQTKITQLSLLSSNYKMKTLT